jgi:hypothetical protein
MDEDALPPPQTHLIEEHEADPERGAPQTARASARPERPAVAADPFQRPADVGRSDNLELAVGIVGNQRRTLLVQMLLRKAMALTMHGDFAATSAAAEKGIAIAELDRGKGLEYF